MTGNSPISGLDQAQFHKKLVGAYILIGKIVLFVGSSG